MVTVTGCVASRVLGTEHALPPTPTLRRPSNYSIQTRCMPDAFVHDAGTKIGFVHLRDKCPRSRRHDSRCRPPQTWQTAGP